MHQLVQAVPIDVLLALEPEELGSKLVFLLRTHGGDKFTVQALINGIQGNPSNGWAGYPRENWDAAERALLEAWNWLEAEGLIVWPDTSNGPGGWRRLSRRARSFENEAALANYAAAARLPKNALHPRIAEMVWLAFVRGDYDTAVFQALREVEVAVREAGAFADGDIGVRLMRRAFGPGAPLRDPSSEEGEANAVADLYAGTIGALKNPQSHRIVDVADPAEAVEIVMTASLLLRILDRRAAASQ